MLHHHLILVLHHTTMLPCHVILLVFSSHHPVTMSHDSTTDRPVIQKEGKGKGKARRGSVSSPPSHHPCGPYINLSRLSLELKQAATLSSHSSHKKPTDHKSISCRKEVRLPHTTNKKDAEKVKTGSSQTLKR